MKVITSWIPKILLVALFVVGLLLTPYPADVNANDWLDCYTYRKLIPITGEAGAGTDYQVPLTVHSNLVSGTYNEILRPNGAGDETNIPSRTGDSTNWECVDDVVADEQVTLIYCALTDPYKRDLYALPAHSEGSGTINSITIYFRVLGWPTVTHYKPVLKSDSTVTEGTEIDKNDFTWETFSQTWTTNPADSAAWEWADIDALQIGIAIDANGGQNDCTQVYVEVNYTTTAGADSQGKVGLINYCTDFPNDIRFADDDGDTELDHWIVDPTADPAKFWIEVKDDLGSNQDIYIYYGKSGASSDSDGDATFPFFDHFDDPVDAINTDKWEGDTGDATVASSILSLTVGSSWASIRSKATTFTYKALGARALFSTDGDAELMGFFDNYQGSESNKVEFYHKEAATNKRIGSKKAGTAEYDANQAAFTVDAYDIFEALWSSGNDGFIVGGTECAGSPHTTQVPTVAQYLLIGAKSDPILVDWVFVRNYIVSEPVVGTPGSLEFRNISYGYIIG